MSVLNLFFLGTPRIEQAAQLVEVDTRKAIAMLAYLALTGERQSRDSLAALLWPEYDTSRAKAALRRTLSTLKTAVPPTSLTISREAIGLAPGHHWCDVTQFHQHLAAGELETAVSLYRDDFLAGFSLRDSIPFDDWQLIQVQTLRRELETALELLIKRHLNRQDYAQALPLAHRWLALDPLREEVHRYLMQLYAWSGQPNAALRQYRDCVRILEEELGVPPLPETSALYEAIQNDRLNGSLLVPEETAVLLPTVPYPAAPALVGRAAELTLMQNVYHQMAPNGRFLAVAGETGIGKTRLAESFLSGVRDKGAVVLSARCYAGEQNLAYAPLIQLLREGLAQPDTGKRLTAVPPPVIAEASRLLPELAAFHKQTLILPALDAPGGQSRFFESVAQVMTTLLAGTVPGVVWLDDAHWLDAASLDLLLFMARRWRERPYLILMAWRAEELAAGHALPLISAEMHRQGVGEQVELARFTPDEVAQVLDAVNSDYPADLPARLFAETEGLPYFVVEYLADLSQQPLSVAGDEGWAIPRTVRDLLHTRLAQVGETERQLLQAAAVIGHAFSFDLGLTVSGRSEEEALTALETLVARGILAEETATSTTLSASVYDFSHEKLRTLAYEETSLARRRLLHRRVAETLAQSASHHVQPAAWAGQIAGHYHLAGRDEQAARFFRQAGDYARSLFAHRDALAHYQMALALGDSETALLHEACGDLYIRLGEYPAALTSYEIAAALADAQGVGRLEHKLVQVYQRQGNWLLAEQKLAQAWVCYGDEVETAVAAQLYIDGSLIAHRQNQAEQAEALAQQALALVQNSADSVDTMADATTLAQTYNILGVLARSRGDLETSATYLAESLRLATAANQLNAQIAAHNNLALTLNAAGENGRAQEQIEQALVLCQTYGDRHHEAALRNNLADLLHQAGAEEAAMAQLKTAVTIFAEIGQEEGVWQAEIWKLSEW
ncbi:MAG: AAA family ATPase [Anaerolineae bacterium]|nr:AAA family ATPase [Anaerolineae bacterium]